MITTLQDKLAKLGELMAGARIERELGIRIIQRRNGDGVAEYLIEHLNEKGEARAVAPTAEWAWRLQSCLYGLVNEMAGSLSELALGITKAQERVVAAQNEAKAQIAVQAAAVAQARTDAYEDGFNAARVAMNRLVMKYREELVGRRDLLEGGILSNSQAARLTEEMRHVDGLALALTNTNPHAEIGA